MIYTRTGRPLICSWWTEPTEETPVASMAVVVVVSVVVGVVVGVVISDGIVAIVLEDVEDEWELPQILTVVQTFWKQLESNVDQEDELLELDKEQEGK